MLYKVKRCEQVCESNCTRIIRLHDVDVDVTADNNRTALEHKALQNRCQLIEELTGGTDRTWSVDDQKHEWFAGNDQTCANGLERNNPRQRDAHTLVAAPVENDADSGTKSMDQ